MWSYERRLQYPVNIKDTDAKAAQIIISQYGGPDGELSASMRYLSQRFTIPYNEVAGLLTDIGTEELGHFEMMLPQKNWHIFGWYLRSCISSRVTFLWKKLRSPVLHLIMWIIHWHCGRRLRAESRKMPVSTSQKEIRSQI